MENASLVALTTRKCLRDVIEHVFSVADYILVKYVGGS